MNYDFQEMPDLHGTGEHKLYPRPCHFGRISNSMFVRELRQRSGMQEAAITGLMSALAECIDHYMSIGHSVKIEGLGVFSPSLSQLKEGEERKSTVTYDHRGVHFNTVNFLPEKEWIHRLRMNTQPQYSGEVMKVREERYNREERLALAKDFLAQQHVMRVADYMALTGLSHTKAANELREFRCDPTSGITSEGQRSSLIYKMSQA